jgi:hypothetical protein
MPPKANATSTTSSRHRKQGMDPAMKAGIGATVCSLLIVALFLLAMQTLPVSVG